MSCKFLLKLKNVLNGTPESFRNNWKQFGSKPGKNSAYRHQFGYRTLYIWENVISEIISDITKTEKIMKFDNGYTRIPAVRGLNGELKEQNATVDF